MNHDDPLKLRVLQNSNGVSKYSSINRHAAVSQASLPSSGASRPMTSPAHDLPPNVTIEACMPEYIPAFRRINTLLLPIRYPPAFYSEIEASLDVRRLAFVALWRDDVQERGMAASNVSNGIKTRKLSAFDHVEERERLSEGGSGVKRKRVLSASDAQHDAAQDEVIQGAEHHMTDAAAQKKSSIVPDEQGTDEEVQLDEKVEAEKGRVIGGIRCRIERLSTTLSSNTSTASATNNSDIPPSILYVQTLTLLSPYRNLSIGTGLLDAAIRSALSHHQNITAVQAHVWEMNSDALAWYQRRGFIAGELIPDYYRRLRPAGARLVRRALGVTDWLRLGVDVDSHEAGKDGTVKEVEGEDER